MKKAKEPSAITVKMGKGAINLRPDGQIALIEISQNKQSINLTIEQAQSLVKVLQQKLP